MRKRKDINLSKQIGLKIKGRRRELKMTQETLSEHLGVSYQQVQRYESGENRVNVEFLQLITQVLQVPFSYFFDETKPKNITVKETYFLKEDENTLIRVFRRIKRDDYKKMVIQLLKLIAEHSKKS